MKLLLAIAVMVLATSCMAPPTVPPPANSVSKKIAKVLASPQGVSAPIPAG